MTFLTLSVTIGQRSNGIGASDNSLWSRPGASTWNSSDSQQYRQSTSRSASPPTSQQDTSNISPSFAPSRTSSLQNTTFSGTNYISFPNQSTHATTSYSAYPESSQADTVNGFQASLAGLQRNGQSQGHFDDSRDSMLPPSRHSENEALQFGSDTSAFGNGFGSHSRQQSRMSLSSGMPASYNLPQQPISRSQSYSFNPQNDQPQATFDAIRAQALRDSVQANANSSGHRGSITQGSSPAPSQLNWRDYQTAGGFGLSAGNYQEARRDSLASLHNSSLNSPRTFGAPRQADPWQSPTTLDPETLSRLQRAQQNTMTRQSTQSSFIDPASFSLYDQTQLLQQMHPGFSMPFQSYGYQTGQQFFPPSGPAGMVPRSGRPQDLTVGVRCQELEEFRRSSKSNRKWELKVCNPRSTALLLIANNSVKNVFGRVVEFAGDQQGSRFLQEKIPTANSDDRQRVFEEIMVDANALMVDVFGNYVVQQLFEHGTMVQKRLLAGKMKNQVVQLSTQLYGCRCVQEVSRQVIQDGAHPANDSHRLWSTFSSSSKSNSRRRLSPKLFVS